MTRKFFKRSKFFFFSMITTFKHLFLSMISDDFQASLDR